MSSLRELEVSRQFPARKILVKHPTGDLVLRPTGMLDAEEIYRALEASLPELKRFMPWSHAPQSPVSQLERLRSGEAEYYSGEEMVMGLFREETMLAMVGLHPRVPLNPTGLEVGYWAPTPLSRQGWTTLAVQLAVVYAIDKLGSERVQVMCDETNIGSRRVIEKCGFAQEGVLRNVVKSVDQTLIDNGYVGTAIHPMFAIFPDTLPRLPWVAPLRASMRYVNLAGYTLEA